MKRILFVCLGNICRSPAAEAIMGEMVRQRGWQDEVDIDSAGTSSYHSGRPADARMAQALKARGYISTSTSRAVDPTSDFDEFDYIVAMDNSNYNDLRNLAEVYGKPQERIIKICDYRNTQTAEEVPDPYYGGTRGFDVVIDILEDALSVFIRDIAGEDPRTPRGGNPPTPP